MPDKPSGELNKPAAQPAVQSPQPNPPAKAVVQSPAIEKRTGEPNVQTALQQLMYGLIYPAVLGTGIVLTGVRAAHHSSATEALLDASIQLGIIAGLFFCASFDSVFYWPSDQQGHYTRWAFAFDFVEVILMFICFHYLGLFEDPAKLAAPHLSPAYAALTGDVLLQFGWRWVVGLKCNYRWRLRASVAGVLVLGFFLGDQFRWLNVAITVTVAVLVVIYVVRDPRYST